MLSLVFSIVGASLKGGEAGCPRFGAHQFIHEAVLLGSLLSLPQVPGSAPHFHSVKNLSLCCGLVTRSGQKSERRRREK